MQNALLMQTEIVETNAGTEPRNEEAFHRLEKTSLRFILFSEGFEAFGLMFLVLERKQLPALLRLCQQSPTPRNPFVLSPHYFPTESYFTGEFPSSSTEGIFSAIISLVIPEEPGSHFELYLILILSSFDLCLAVPNHI